MIEGARRGKTHENTENKEENKIRDSGGDKKEYKKGGREGRGMKRSCCQREPVSMMGKHGGYASMHTGRGGVFAKTL